MTNNKQRTPRKLKKRIPKNTPYCYGKYRCPFYRHDKNILGWCKAELDIVFDSIKICKIK